MTDIIITKAGAPLVVGVATVLAVIDPSVTNIVLAVIAAFVVIIPLWFKFKTDAMNARMAAQDIVVNEQNLKIKELTGIIDTMKLEIIKITGERNQAVGKAEGIVEAEAKAATIAAAKAEGVAEGKAVEKPA